MQMQKQGASGLECRWFKQRDFQSPKYGKYAPKYGRQVLLNWPIAKVAAGWVRTSDQAATWIALNRYINGPNFNLKFKQLLFISC